MSGQLPTPRLASDAVHTSLRGEILDGTLVPGDAVPSERVLAERFGVNRHAIREALKRLQQAGLIRISQGGATRVLDWRGSGGLEVLLDLMDSGAEPPEEIVRSVVEMRASIGIDAARLCSERASAHVRERIGELADETATALDEEDEAAMDLFVALWSSIVDGSANLAYRLAINSLNRALDLYPDLAAALFPNDPEGLRALAAGFRGGDSQASSEAARRLLEPPTA